MRWASSLSVASSLEVAAREACEQISGELGGETPDLILAFVSSRHGGERERLPGLVRRCLGGGLLVGCSASGVIGRGTEAEARPALSLTAAVLPDVDLIPFHLGTTGMPGPGARPAEWERCLGVSAERGPHFLLFPEPRTFPVEPVLSELDRAYPMTVKAGGVASAGPHGDVLYLGGSAYHGGAVGVAMAGNVEIDPVVAQGCRPIGEPMFVTRCQGTAVFELDGRPAATVLHELYERAEEKERKLFRRALCMGIVMRRSQQEYRPGDFLVRNLVGLDEESGAVVVAAAVEENQVVQFHVRDARASARDLDELLERYARDHRRPRPEGALLFSCVGRGMALYGRPDHDTGVFRAHLGEVPLGGFFCNGEIGMVQGRTFLHGYTSSFALFRGRARA
ncbi:MAG: hypothetical protein D6760_03285 [Deltaproteobacteria bacterium]|nr:MAG: hypothetical protein D6760_03285 [Deltaproteobacteria bacterium]